MRDSGKAAEPLILSVLESFYIGGEVEGFLNPAGARDQRLCGAMYVQRLRPAKLRFPFPVLFIHGGCHTGVTWETTPDGREGWAQLFVRQGFETFVIDQPRRGRSAPLMEEAGSAWSAGFSAIRLFTREGGRFPEAHSQTYASQLWPDFGIGDAVGRGHPGYSDPRALPPLVDLLDRLGRTVLVTHSQGADLGWRAALQRPSGVAAIFSVEPGITTAGINWHDFSNIPVRIMWGDNLPVEGEVLTRKDVEDAQLLAEQFENVSLDWLPAAGIHGNGHMLMMEDNSADLAARAMTWLRECFPMIGDSDGREIPTGSSE